MVAKSKCYPKKSQTQAELDTELLEKLLQGKNP